MQHAPLVMHDSATPRELVDQCGGFAVATGIRLWFRTLDFQAAYYNPCVDPGYVEYETRRPNCIYLFWHEYMAYQFYLRGNCDVAILLSRHRDAEWMARACRRNGFSTVRGSTYRGALGAVRGLLRQGGRMHLALTPDGPRGPRRRMSTGPIYLASKLNMPLVAIGMGYDRPWRLPSWDRFAVPRPMSRARAVWGPAIEIPATLDRDETEHYRSRTEAVLNRLTLEAEAWAEAGSRKINQVVTHPQLRTMPRPVQKCVTPLAN